jgi:transposase-like protein
MQGADRKNGKKYTEAEIYGEAVAGYRTEEQVCPKCFALGQLVGHGSYERNIVYERGGETTYSRLVVARYKCKSCGATHALLPDILVAYSAYSLVFKLRVLLAYFGGKETVAGICGRFGIAVSTVYAWKAQFLEDKELLLGVLSSVGTSSAAAIVNLLGSDDISGTLRRFAGRFGFSFLQGRRKTTRSVPP